MQLLRYIFLFVILLPSCKPKTGNTYYPDGSIHEEFRPRVGHPGYAVTVYNEDGTKNCDVEYSRDSLQDGTSIFFHENGNISSQVTFIKGVENGLFRSYYESGNKKIEVHFVRGKKEGKFKEYFEDGTLRTEQDCYDGKTTGAAVFYFENGNLNQKQLLINSRLLCTTFYDSLDPGEETQTDIAFLPTEFELDRGDLEHEFPFPSNVDMNGCKMVVRFNYLDGNEITDDAIAVVKNNMITYPIRPELGSHVLEGMVEVDSARAKIKFPITVNYKVVR